MARRYMFRAKFHLSPIENVTSINKFGLLGSKARKDNHRIWLCDHEMIPHIAIHLLDHHGWSSHRYIVYAVRHSLLQDPIRKHASGIYYYVGNIPNAFIDQHCTITADNETIQRIMERECAR